MTTTAKHLLSEIVAGLDGVRIPDDIMKAADKAFKYGFGLRYEVAIKAIAQEIYAERQRARRHAFKEVGQKARQWAEHYPQSSDGRNTFTLFAEWADDHCAKAEPNSERGRSQP